MSPPLYLPSDAVTGRHKDLELVADYLELSAFLSRDFSALTSEITNPIAIAGVQETHDSDEDTMDEGEALIAGTVETMANRRRVLLNNYPFRLDDCGHVVRCELSDVSLGRCAYIVSLVLSNLRWLTPVLGDVRIHPRTQEVEALRMYFQYFATAALAAEIQGDAWSFGFPRPDGSGFLEKLKSIWVEIRDGQVGVRPGSPSKPKDDQVDVFAARQHRDRWPGFLLAVAQVATGKRAYSKSLTGHIKPFRSRWFYPYEPVTDFIPYMIVPFVSNRERFMDHVQACGNVLHRLRVPRRVDEARYLVEEGRTVEGYERLQAAVKWVHRYRERVGQL